MTQMVRKQIYIQKRQQLLLRRLARLQGVSEAEIIRQAIDREVESRAKKPLSGQFAGLQSFLKFARSRQAGNQAAAGRAWKRDDLYDDRLNRNSRTKE